MTRSDVRRKLRELRLHSPIGRNPIHTCERRAAETPQPRAPSDVRLLRSAVAHLKILSTAQRTAVLLAAIFYAVAGTLHFIRPEPYSRIMPPYIPWHRTMVQVSGVFEILGGLGLLVSA